MVGGQKMTKLQLYYVVLVVTVLCVAILYRMIYSKTGRAFRAVKGNPIAAESMGINVNMYKTTLVRTISGILRPSRGAIRHNGEDITKWGNDKIVQNGIIQVPEGRQIFSELTVLENIRMGAYCRKDSRESIEADIKEVFALFPRLEERVSQKGGSLSGGEQQMLAFGRALMSKPKILLLDEPSMGLAPIIVADIFQCVKKIASQGVTVVVIEQNVKMALKVSDYAYVLETGAVVNEGPSVQQPGIFLWNVPRQSEPAVKTVVCQLYGILSVGLDASQIVVPVTMHQLRIDDGNI